MTHWNGTPIQLAVEANAAREAGSNKAAQHAQGLQNMTLRAINMSLPPDEDWVDITYKVDGATHETRVPWRVFETGAEVTDPGTLPSLPTGVKVAAHHLVGMDLRTELTRRVKRRLFAPATMQRVPGPKGAKKAAKAARAGARKPRVSATLAAGPVATNRPDEIKARIVDTPSGTFGHLRIFTFHMQDQNIDAFLNEVARLLSELPPKGLVLDVRGNGGGYVIAAEFLLQFLSPRRIMPEPFQFVSTPGTTGLARTVADYEDWKASLEEAVTTGSAYSTAFPLYTADVVNSVGQLYQGPVVLVTDAQCYSACDIFAAGFQDHEIGPVLGVEANTGAGGANVVTHEDLRTEWSDGPLKQLPKGVQMRVALRRCLRVGTRFGQPVEDLGVVPDALHALTKRDLLEENTDLMAAAGALLAQRTPRLLQLRLRRGGHREAQALRHHGSGRQHRRVRQRSTGRDEGHDRRQQRDHGPRRRGQRDPARGVRRRRGAGRGQPADRLTAGQSPEADVGVGISKIHSRPSSSSHCSPLRSKGNWAIRLSDGSLSGEMVARSTRTSGCAAARSSSSCSTARAYPRRR